MALGTLSCLGIYSLRLGVTPPLCFELFLAEESWVASSCQIQDELSWQKRISGFPAFWERISVFLAGGFAPLIVNEAFSGFYCLCCIYWPYLVGVCCKHMTLNLSLPASIRISRFPCYSSEVGNPGMIQNSFYVWNPSPCCHISTELWFLLILKPYNFIKNSSVSIPSF